jgi:hypothetical protein
MNWYATPGERVPLNAVRPLEAGLATGFIDLNPAFASRRAPVSPMRSSGGRLIDMTPSRRNRAGMGSD